ncbi:hypothetical protein F9K33_08090 [bacterium]|nr:MAG: hypothetical protein F9K33_08090 [bacterium]
MSSEQQSTLVVPSLALPLDITDSNGKNIGQGEAFKLWASIPANDEVGVIIDNVLPGDEIIIYDASGIASFKETSMALIKGVVGIANALGTTALMFATDGAAAPFVSAWDSALDNVNKAIGDAPIKHGRRDAYGQDPGTGDYAKDEGGLVVCMPETSGAIYATDDYHFADGAKSHGRKYEYYSKKAKANNVLFPCNVSGGLMSATATKAGAIHVLAFDEKFTDNAGSYTVGLVVIRGQRPSGKSRDAVYAEIVSAGPSGV